MAKEIRDVRDKFLDNGKTMNGDHSLVHDFRDLFTPYDSNWTASRGSIRSFMRKLFGAHRTPADGGYDPQMWIHRYRSILTLPSGIPTFRCGVKLDPLTTENVTIYVTCYEADGTAGVPKSIVVAAEQTARNTAVLSLLNHLESGGCAMGLTCSCPDTHEISFNAPSTPQAAINDSAADVSGCTLSVAPIELAQTVTDFRSA
jgi:hypothetical protein